VKFHVVASGGADFSANSQRIATRVGAFDVEFQGLSGGDATECKKRGFVEKSGGGRKLNAQKWTLQGK
jgi:hypothetical protein